MRAMSEDTSSNQYLEEIWETKEVCPQSAIIAGTPDISKEWEIVPYLTTFRMSKKNASFAEVQKFLPYMAICKVIVAVKYFK